jgi:hypothetical protein
VADQEIVAAAIEVVARRIVHIALTRESVGWEDFPDLGETDFGDAEERALAIVRDLQAPDAAYDEAYRVLAARADRGKH